jgi:hypothetical protein
LDPDEDFIWPTTIDCAMSDECRRWCDCESSLFSLKRMKSRKTHPSTERQLSHGAQKRSVSMILLFSQLLSVGFMVFAATQRGLVGAWQQHGYSATSFQSCTDRSLLQPRQNMLQTRPLGTPLTIRTSYFGKGIKIHSYERIGTISSLMQVTPSSSSSEGPSTAIEGLESNPVAMNWTIAARQTQLFRDMALPYYQESSEGYVNDRFVGICSCHNTSYSFSRL